MIPDKTNTIATLIASPEMYDTAEKQRIAQGTVLSLALAEFGFRGNWDHSERDENGNILVRCWITPWRNAGSDAS